MASSKDDTQITQIREDTHFERIKEQNPANEREVEQKKVDGVKCLYFTHLTLLKEMLQTVMQPPALLKNNRVFKAKALMQKLGNAN